MTYCTTLDYRVGIDKGYQNISMTYCTTLDYRVGIDKRNKNTLDT